MGTDSRRKIRICLRFRLFEHFYDLNKRGIIFQNVRTTQICDKWQDRHKKEQAKFNETNCQLQIRWRIQNRMRLSHVERIRIVFRCFLYTSEQCLCNKSSASYMFCSKQKQGSIISRISCKLQVRKGSQIGIIDIMHCILLKLFVKFSLHLNGSWKGHVSNGSSKIPRTFKI